MHALVALVATSITEIDRLDLIHLRDVSHLDHRAPSPPPMVASRSASTPSRRCGVRVVTTKQQLLDRWRDLDCEVTRGPNDPPRDPACKTP
jgi:hypothetical protein